MTPAEQRYAPIEKEMFGLLFGCELLHGKSDVTIDTDHKPLEIIMRKPIHTAPMRIQKKMIRLQSYSVVEFNLIYLESKEIGLTDCLSRLPLQDSNAKSIDDDMMLFHKTLSHTNHETLVEAPKKTNNYRF